MPLITEAEVLAAFTGQSTNAKKAAAVIAAVEAKVGPYVTAQVNSALVGSMANVGPKLDDIAAAIRERPAGQPVTPPAPPAASEWMTFKNVVLTPGNWGSFNPSTWGESKLAGGIPWSANDAFIRGDDAVVRVSDTGCGQIQAGDTTYAPQGLWEVDVTFGPCVDGLIQAPLWLYNHNTGDEIDFEVVGTKGLHISPHTWAQFDMGGGVVPNLGDLSGQRHKLGIELIWNKSVTWFVDGLIVGRKLASEFPPGVFIKSDVKAYFDAWPTSNAGWAGEWKGTQGKALETVIHAYKFTPIP